MSGSGTTVAEGGLTLYPSSLYDYLDQRTFLNQGAAVFTASSYRYNTFLFLSSGATFDNQATGSFDFRGDNLYVASGFGTPSGGTFDNDGSLTKSTGSGTSAVEAGVVFNENDNARLTVSSGTLSLNCGLSLLAQGYIASAASATLLLSGGVTGTTGNVSLFKPQGSLTIQGPGSAASPELLEVMSQDLGSDPVGFQGNFHYGALALASGAYVRLVDQAHNSAASAGPEALYVNSLIVPTGTTLDMSGLAVYTRESQINGMVINGTIHRAVSGGPIELGDAVPGTIASAGQVDSWTFFGRAGTGATVEVNPGNASLPEALVPFIGNAQVSLIDPNNNVLAMASDANTGELLTLLDVSLPVDGVYTIQVKAGASLPDSTGHYLVTLYSAVTSSQRAALDQVVHGALGSPYDVNNYTFAASANQQITFNLLGATNPTIEFTLTAPDGTILFQHQKASTSLISLSQAGTYTLSVDAFFGSPGAYSFRIDQTALASLTLGSAYEGSLSGSDEPQLFTVQVDRQQNLLVVLSDAMVTDQDELYLKFGAPPTRSDYQYRFTPPASGSPQVLALSAAPGTWYILVYAASVRQQSTYTIIATSGDILLTGSTPDHSAANSDTTLTLTGAGFDQTTSVTLVDSSGTHHSPSSFTIDLPTQITALLADLSLPPGTYSVEVSKPGITPAVLADALTIDPQGSGKLVTSMVVPWGVGWHDATTLYVQYSNTGDAPIPAPLLVVDAYTGHYVWRVNLVNFLSRQHVNQMDFNDFQSALNFQTNFNLDENSGEVVQNDLTDAEDPVFVDNTVHGAILALDPTVGQGFWTVGSLRAGFSHTIEFLASGKTPGVLQPGESVQVPVYYSGWGADGRFDPKNFTLSTINQTDSTPIDWSSIQAGLQPPGMSSAAWNGMFAKLTAGVGEAWGDFVRLLDQNASYLGRLGENVSDISLLWRSVIQQAMGFNVVPTIASNVDASVPVPGLSLDLGQSYSPSILDRETLGPLGLGWSLDGPWQEKLITQPDKSVAIEGPNGLYRLFQPDSRKSEHYFTQPGDYGTLILNGGTFSVQEIGGSSTHFLADGQVDYVQDTNGNRITAGYTGGLLTSLTHSDGQSIQISYNAAGRIDLVTDPYGRKTVFTYDPNNTLLLSVTNYDGTGQTYTYQAADARPSANALASVRYTDGVTDTFTYETLGRLSTASQNGGANTSTISYPGEGEVDLTNTTGDTSRLFFDARGLLVKTVDPIGNPAYRSFDSSYNLVTATGPTGLSSSFSYNGVGQVTQIVDPLGGLTQFAYNGPFNAETSLTDANGNVTRYGYDASGNRVSTTYANGSTSKVTYDSQGNPIGTVNPNGQAIAYTYDPQGQITSQTFANGTVETYGYDARGNLVQTVDPTGTTAYAYDANDRLVQVTYPANLYLKFTYDAAGRRTSSTDQTGYTLNYTYDALGNLATITDASGAPIVTYAYDADQRLSRKDMGNGTFTTYTYDGDGNITALINHAPDSTINSEFLYTYDSRGLVTSMTTLEGKWTYAYDALGQLTGWNAPDGTFATYSYDAMGNRVLVNDNGIQTAYTTNNMNQYVTVGGDTYTYDADGNLIRKQSGSDVTNYSYDPHDRLIAVTHGADSQTYSYDALGNMVASTNDNVAARKVIDPIGLRNVVGMYDDSGNLLTRFDFGIGLISQGGALGNTAYYDFDLTGSTVGITDSSGQYINHYNYTPFGGIESSLTQLRNSFTFLGEWGVEQGQNGLDSTRARFYSPEQGRFISADPLGLGTRTVYTYSLNSPLNYVDVNGYLPSAAENLKKLKQLKEAFVLGKDDGEAIKKVLDAGKKGDDEALLTALHEILGVYPPTAEAIKLYDAIKSEDLGTGDSSSSGEAPTNQPEFWFPPAGTELPPLPSILQDLQHPRGPTGPSLVPDLSASSPGDNGGGGKPSEKNPITYPTIPVHSSDPNELVGPSGYGYQGFITPDRVFGYRVNFENSPNATAPAQQVDVTDPLNANLDWSTFQFTQVGFGDTNITIPAGSQYFATTAPMTYNGKTFDVQIELGFSVVTGQVYAHFYSIDPSTQLPPDVLTGFLPPEDGTGRGNGYFCYVVNPKAGLTTGTPIRNVAAVTFDLDKTITTDQVSDDDPSLGVDPAKQALNTIDVGTPTSSVASLPATETAAAFTVSWAGQDDAGGAGIATFDVFVSDNGGGYILWQHGTPSTTARFLGSNGHTYSFYSIATDNVGLVESKSPTAEATTLVDAPVVDTGTVIAASENPASFGDSITFTANVTLVSSGKGIPTGSVQFLVDGVAVGSPVLLLFGTASYTTSALPAGQHDLSVQYTSDNGAFNPSTGELAGGLSITPGATAGTAVSLQSPGPATVYGQTITLSALVSAVTPGLPIPTGSIEFFDGAAEIGTAHVDATGTASREVSNLSAADHTITAHYLGDPDFSGSTSAELTRTVDRAHLTVTADDKSKTYGASNPGLTYSLSGFVNGETASVVTGAPSLSTTATAESPVGTYAITAGLGSLSSADYDFPDIVAATLSVTPAPLTIRADDKVREVGQPNPPLTVSYAGFVNGDGPSSLTAPAVLSTTATAGSAAGTYPIAVGGAASPNYAITFLAGTLTIAPPQGPPTQPPLVTVVNVHPTFDKKHRLTQILVTFSGPVDAAEAQGLGIYSVVIAGKTGSFTARNAKAVALKSAVFSAAHETVTLALRKPFKPSKPVQLRVNGLSPSGLEDSVGRLIDGNHDGQPGGDAVAVLRNGGAKISAMAYRGTGTAPAFEPSLIDALLERDYSASRDDSASAARQIAR
jgi:RHS repeat-associated protein